MNIDVYIDLLKLHCENLDHEEMDGIANWLEELKTLRMTDRECVYHKAYEQGKADERAKVIEEIIKFRDTENLDEYEVGNLNELIQRVKSVE